MVRESRHDMTSPHAVRARLPRPHALFPETRMPGQQRSGGGSGAGLGTVAPGSGLWAPGTFTVMWLVDDDFV